MVIVFGLTACSSFKLIYQLVDDFIEREAAFFLKLDEEGKIFLNHQVEELMAWHKNIILPRYAAYLRDQAAHLYNDEFSKVVVTKSIAKGLIILTATVAGAAKYAARILVRHTSTKDILHVRRKILERQLEHKEILARPKEEQIELRAKRITKNFERFLVDLNDTQLHLISLYAKSTVDETRKRTNNRNLRQSAFLTFLAGKPTEKEIAIFIERILLRSHEIVDPGYRDFSKASINRFAVLLVRILAASTHVQRKATAENLRKYAQDFIELSD